MDYLPVFLDIRNKRCLVVGGGEVACRKAGLLLRAGGRLEVISPECGAALRQLCESAKTPGKVVAAPFKAKHLEGPEPAVLVVAATDDQKVNRAVYEAAVARGIPVNVVDQPALCSFIVPAMVHRQPVLVAISSGGASPVLTRQIKALNEVMLPARMGDLARLLAEYRQEAQKRLTDFRQRLRFWEEVVESEIPELVYRGRAGKAAQAIEARLHKAAASTASGTAKQGEVYLVGAGPGDPDLLTLRALRLLHKADVVLYDRLVSTEVLQRVRPDAEKIHVGKQQNMHTMSQQAINELMLRLAKEGKRVLRLKGGDPFIFGRGGEELEQLAGSGIPFQVVPGITAASGCAAYAGIPLTHRDYAHSVQFLTGHLKAPEDDDLNLDWPDLVRGKQTLVFYMGLLSLPVIVARLLEHGMDQAMPVAIVQQGTTARQRVLCATLGNLLATVAAAEPLQPPTLTIIGEVVGLRERLDWHG